MYEYQHQTEEEKRNLLVSASDDITLQQDSKEAVYNGGHPLA